MRQRNEGPYVERMRGDCPRALRVRCMSKGLLYGAFLGFAAASLSGCALQVRSDVNRTAFHAGQCHTFAFNGSFRTDNPMRGTVANPVNESRLRAAITSHMQTIGVQLAKENPDCLVGYGIGTNVVVDPGYPMGPYPWGFPYGGWGGPYVYREGMIGIDLYDAKTHEPLWHAQVDQNLYHATGADAEQKIDAAVAALFTHFPT